jgi:diguanylate cyclase (GGDEF)-like protein/PAS domain S-box-containing protein
MKWNIAAEYISLAFVFILIIYSWGKDSFTTLKNKLFRLFLLVVFIEISVSIGSIHAIENYKLIPDVINQVIQMVYFLIAPLISLFFTVYIISAGWEDDPKIKSFLGISLIPFILYAPVVLTNPLTHLLYSISVADGFSTGKWFILTYVIHIVYSIAMLIIAMARRKKLNSRLSMVFLSFPLISLFMLSLQAMFPNIIFSGSAASIVSLIVYLFIQNEQKEALKESEERFRNLFALKGDALFVIDKENGDILEVNESACNIYGYSREEMLNLKSMDMSYEPDETAKAAKEMDTEQVEIPLRFHKKKDGIVFPVEITATLLNWKNKNALLVVSKDITERRQTENNLIYLSYHDQLTGLYNRRFFEEELLRLDTRRNLPLSIAMGDVNGLKLVNDSFGHLKGDQLLKSVALVMRKVCREDDILARLGGDEFAIILPNTSETDAEKVVTRIMDNAATEKIEGLGISISFGYQTKITDDKDINLIMKETEERMYRLKLNESSSMRNKTITLIMNTLFEKNKREMEHSERVSEICVSIATEMDFDKNSINRLRTVGLMHDIGKIGIEESILNSQTTLSPTEWIEIKKHSEIGFRILKSSTDFADIAEDVYAHHERWDGQGYPRGIKEEDISIFARIISVADAFDAMVSERPYRVHQKSMEINDAIDEIRKNAGTQFDPQVAKIFVEKVMKLTW